MCAFMADEGLPVNAVRWLYSHRSKSIHQWKPFCGYDSIRLENAFRERKNGNEDPSFDRIVVRGEMFEVDITKNLCMPIYWFGKKRSVHSKKKTWCSTPVIRVIWFQKINWMPINPELSDIIEQEHRTYVIPLLKESHEKKGHKTIHRYRSENHEVKWMADGNVYLITKTAEPFGRVKLHGGLSSVPLSRGYHHFCDINDRPPPITHLCFVVHGIGQQLASIRHECAKIRKTCTKVAEKLYPNLASTGQRLEFIPVNWRSSLHLNSETLENITVSQLRPLRAFINHCFVDILYYTSPIYRQVIMQSLSLELLRLFNLFCTKNPYFLQRGGQISVLAHSLGTVIMHDILRNSESRLSVLRPDSALDLSVSTNGGFDGVSVRRERGRSNMQFLSSSCTSSYSRSCSLDPEATIRVKNRGSFLENVSRPADWKPLPQLANLFLIGSPLALFITVNDLPSSGHNSTESTCSLSSNLSNSFYPNSVELEPTNVLRFLLDTLTTKHSGQDLDETDVEALFSYFSCRRVFNIFHSYDPVAYRIEPLLLRNYSNISPVVIPKASAHHLEKWLSSKPSDKSFKGSRTSLVDSNQEKSPVLQKASSTESLSDTHSYSDGTIDLSDSNSSDSEDGSASSNSEQEERNFYRRMSMVDENTVYKQHKSLVMKMFSNYVTRRSSNVTYLGPNVCKMRSVPDENEKHLRKRVDYEWQKSFSPLAVLSAHSSYWSSRDVAFFMLYQIFGPPQSRNN